MDVSMDVDMDVRPDARMGVRVVDRYDATARRYGWSFRTDQREIPLRELPGTGRHRPAPEVPKLGYQYNLIPT